MKLYLYFQFNILYNVYNFQPLVSLIRPDFEKWKPLKPKNQLLMAIEHGFAEPTAIEDKDFIEIDNIVNEFLYFQLFFNIYFYAFFEFQSFTLVTQI